MSLPFTVAWRNKLAWLWSWATNTPLDLTQGQIKFPATQNASADANTLDDYEEGTFTPGIAFGGGTTGITYSTQNGNYTKIGNIINYALSITLTSKGSSTGTATVTGLPFTAGGSVNWRGPISYNTVDLNVAGGYYSPSMSFAASTSITLQEQGDNIAPASLTDADFSNTSQLSITSHYQV